MKQFQLELWPGYITSVRQHEKNILVCCEVSHKVMRMETIRDILINCRRAEERNWQDCFKKEIIGSIVLTAYNNKTYRIDDVDFTSSPSSTFKRKDVDVTYANYYQEKYKLEIMFVPVAIKCCSLCRSFVARQDSPIRCAPTSRS